MLIELPLEKYDILYNIKELHLFPIISSVIYIKQKGTIYVDNIESPQIIYIIHKSSFSYLYNSVPINADEFLHFLVSNNKIPQYSHIYKAEKELILSAERNEQINIRIRKRVRMKGMPSENFILPSLPSKFTIKNISDIPLNDFSSFNLSITEKYWDTIDDMKKEGLGWVVYDNTKPVTICYTPSIVNNNCETDILTMPEYRGKGLGLIAGMYLLKSCVEKNINMEWDVFTDNIPSIKIGEKFGFIPYFKYDFLSIFKKNTIL